MDKVIIDKVDVSGCKYCDDGTCCDKDVMSLSCENTDCIYKQLKRLEQENEQLKKSIDRIIQEKEIKTIDLDIAKENAELKAENERLKEEIEIRDNLSETFRKEALSWANIANEYQKDKTKLKQALQEIRDMADFKCALPSTELCHCKACDYADNIIAKINEVIGEE